MVLSQVRYAAFHTAEEIPDQVDWAVLHLGISLAQELLQCQADYF
jgi:hypothetical protein